MIKGFYGTYFSFSGRNGCLIPFNHKKEGYLKLK